MTSVGITPCGPVAAEDVRDLRSWPGHVGRLHRRRVGPLRYPRREPLPVVPPSIAGRRRVTITPLCVDGFPRRPSALPRPEQQRDGGDPEAGCSLIVERPPTRAASCLTPATSTSASTVFTARLTAELLGDAGKRGKINGAQVARQAKDRAAVEQEHRQAADVLAGLKTDTAAMSICVKRRSRSSTIACWRSRRPCTHALATGDAAAPCSARRTVARAMAEQI